MFLSGNGPATRYLIAMDLKQYIRDIPDFPKPGILFKDITPLLADPVAFRHSVDLLAIHYDGHAVDAFSPG